jgi:hypothetical protein
VETKIANSEVKSQTTWTIAKSLMKMDGTTIPGSLGLTFYPLEEASAIADFLENQSTLNLL